MASYKEKDNFAKMDWALPIQRTDKFPLDRSSMFGSLEDAKKYALGAGDDSRKLGGTSYIGQIITVYENSKVEVYKIAENKTLEKVGNGLGTITAENYDAAVLLAKSDNIGQVIYCLNDQKNERGEFAKGPYIVTAEGTLLKLASSTASGDVTKDVQDLQTAVGKLEGVVGHHTTGDTDPSTGLVKATEDNKAEIDKINGAGEGSIKKALADSKEYTDSQVSSAIAHKVNGKEISKDPTLDGRDIQLTGYVKGSKSAISVTDTVNAAFGKLEAGAEANSEAIKILNATEENSASVSGKIKAAIEELDVNDTAVSGEYISQVTETNGKISVTREKLPDAAGLANEALTSAKAYTDELSNGQVTTNKNSIEKINGLLSETGNIGKGVKDNAEAIAQEKIDREAAITGLTGTTTGSGEVIVSITQTDGKVTATLGNASAANVTLADTGKHTSETSVEGAIAELYTKEEGLATELGSKGVQSEETAFGLIAKNAKEIATLKDVTVGGTHFIGVTTGELSTTNIVTDVYSKGRKPEAGDFVIKGQKEYIFSAGAWVELGDTTEEGKKITALENKTADVETTVGALIESKVSAQAESDKNAYAVKATEGKVTALEGKFDENGRAVDAAKLENSTKEQVINDARAGYETAKIAEGKYAVKATEGRVEAIEEFFDMTETGEKGKALRAKAADTATSATTAATATAVAEPERQNIIDAAAAKSAEDGNKAYAVKGTEAKVTTLEGYFNEGGVAKTAAIANKVESTERDNIITTAREGYETQLQAEGKYVQKSGTDRLMKDAEGKKLEGIAAGAQVNVLETITVNGASDAVSVSEKNVDIKQETAHVKLSSKPQFSGVESGVTMDAVLTDIYAKLNDVNGAKVSSVTAEDESVVITGEADPKVKVNVRPDANNLIQQDVKGGLFAAMYYDGNDAESATPTK